MDLLTEEQIRSFKKVFDTYDVSGNGDVDSKELGVLLRAVGIFASEAEINDIIASVDVSGDGRLDFAEFLNLMCSQ